jgi:hypothetical protein
MRRSMLRRKGSVGLVVRVELERSGQQELSVSEERIKGKRWRRWETYDPSFRRSVDRTEV